MAMRNLWLRILSPIEERGHASSTWCVSRATAWRMTSGYSQGIWQMPQRFWQPIRLAKRTDSWMSDNQTDSELVDSSVRWDTHGTMLEHSLF
eukprot:2805696-Rhodomonas_salina.1